MIEQIKSYKTSDGQLHVDKIKALEHEEKIELRSLFQSLGKLQNGNLSTTDAATIILNNPDSFVGVLNKYKLEINKAKGTQKRAQTMGFAHVN